MMEQREFPDIAMDSYSCTALCSFTMRFVYYTDKVYTQMLEIYNKETRTRLSTIRGTLPLLLSLFDLIRLHILCERCFLRYFIN